MTVVVTVIDVVVFVDRVTVLVDQMAGRVVTGIMTGVGIGLGLDRIGQFVELGVGQFVACDLVELVLTFGHRADITSGPGAEPSRGFPW